MVFDYYFSRSKADEQPHFYNYYLDQQPPYDIEIQLPNLVINPITDNAWFRLEVTSGTAYKLIVDSKIWDFKTTPSIRTEVLDAYRTFLGSLESNGMGAIGVKLVKTRLAEVIPVTFNELLFYHYGLNQAEGYVDLQPGMRLRVDYQNYQLVHPAQDQRLHGYTGGGTSYLQIATQRSTGNGSQLSLSFDPFVVGMQNVLVEAGAGDGSSVAGIIDLHKSAYRKPYLRLFYPNAYPGISSAGWFGTEKNITLIGADTTTNLQRVTDDEYLKKGAVTSGNGQAFYFRGRTTVIPEIAIQVNGQSEYVALGATFRQLLERYLSVPGAMDGQDLSQIGVQAQRLMHQGLDGKQTYRTIHFEHYQVYSDGSDVYDIPLLKGDRITLG